MNEHFPELNPTGDMQPPTARQLIDLFGAVQSYNDGYDANWHALSMTTLKAEAQDAPNHDLLQNLEDIKQDENERHSLGRELLELVHRDTIRSSGLVLEGGHYLYPLIGDGQRLAQALHAASLEDGQQELLPELQDFFFDCLKNVRDVCLYREPERAKRIFGRELPEDWIVEEDEWTLPELHSVDELLKHGPLLAAPMDTYGAVELANTLRRLTTFHEEGDLACWGIASWFGLLPETAPDRTPDLGEWHTWEHYDQWQPLFRVLHATNPIGSFSGYLKRCALKMLEREMSFYEQVLTQDYDQFAAQHGAFMAGFAEEPDDTDSPSRAAEKFRHAFGRAQENAARHLGQFKLVVEQLVAYPV